MSNRTVVLLHGAGMGSWVWERVIAASTGPTLALDVPARKEGVTPEGCARELVDAIDAAGVEDVVLAVHSLSGVLAPALAALLGSRLKHVVYVAAIVPAAGRSFAAVLGFPARFVLPLLFRFNRSGLMPSESMIRKEICNDLAEEDAATVVARYEAEYPGLYLNPVKAPANIPSTYVRLMRDAGVPPTLQASMIARLPAPEVVEIGAGHLVMLSKPDELAAVLASAAGST